jgi:hypothetical protein
VRQVFSSHALLISPGDARSRLAPRERKCCASVAASRVQLAIITLAAAALLLSFAPRALSAADPGAGGTVKGPSGKGAEDRGPSKKVRGRYVLKIAGHYTGSGEARATDTGVKLSARVKDPDGKMYTLSARQLDVVNDRFSGTGMLNGAEVQIDGRVDPQDQRNGQVLKKGRITFTFRSADGHHGRGAGDQRERDRARQ